MEFFFPNLIAKILRLNIFFFFQNLLIGIIKDFEMAIHHVYEMLVAKALIRELQDFFLLNNKEYRIIP